MTSRGQREIDGLAILQEWEGYVLEVVGDQFVARLIDLTAGSSHEDEEAIIPLSEISHGDAAALQAGGIFRWIIGYERSPSGIEKCVSRIVFRRCRRMTDREYQKGQKWASETRRAFKL